MASSRPKGYMAEWTPQPHVAAVVVQVREVLEEYRSYGPMTVRQIFYRLVGQYGYPKDERAYKRLAEWLVKARRARMIPFGSIRDDGTVSKGGQGYDTPKEFWEGVESSASYFRMNRQKGQPKHIELWAEAAGMAPMLARMVDPYDVTVYSTGGFSSVTVTHETALRVVRRIKDDGRPTVFLHVGDYDPSGESIFQSMSQDIGGFVTDTLGGEWYPDSGHAIDKFEPIRVALTPDQIEEHQFETAPPKASDSRSASWDGFETVQLEAVPPPTLEEIVVSEIESHMDLEVWAELKDTETDEGEKIMEKMTEIMAEFGEDGDDGS